MIQVVPWKSCHGRECLTRMRHDEPRQPAEIKRRQHGAGHVRDRLAAFASTQARRSAAKSMMNTMMNASVDAAIGWNGGNCVQKRVNDQQRRAQRRR